ncbi:MAG: anaerobic ribonucleoside-triphosphate reductase activating protein [Clostridia bacterium]|nr:anaerobic ribonucleoside-triphosphate reductase activating protein [Clostridia bacterium]
MIIKGLQKITLLDFPGKVACTVFTGGCNFRCPFCHNDSLVTHSERVKSIPEEEIFSYLSRRKGVLDGVGITGGEPLLQKDIADFCRKVHDMGLLVKLDTNGSFPDRLRALLDEGLVDYIAMDIKNCKEAYAETCGLKDMSQELEKIEESIRLIMSVGIPYEFRTTVVREFHSEARMEALAKEIAGAERFFLQTFTDSGDLIGGGLSAYSAEEMEKLLSIVKPYVPTTELRGI